MSLPNPDDYADWRDYARVLVQALDGNDPDQVVAIRQIASGVVPPPRAYPTGFAPIWLSQAEAELYLGNKDFDPPRAADLFQIDTKQIAEAAIETSQLADLAVDIRKLAAASVDFDKLLDGAVGEAKLANLAVAEAKIKNLAVSTAKIQDLLVTTAKIADLAVATAKINELAVATAKIAEAAIVSAKIGDLQVVEAKIAELAVNSAKIANLAVTSAKIANLAVGVAHIQAAAIGTAAIQDLAVVAAKIANLAVLNAKIGDAQVSTAKIGFAQITAALIGALAVGSAAIQDLSVTNAKIGDAQITSAKIAELVVSKLTSGQLNAIIDVGSGLFRFSVGGSTLILGNGFGSTGQFFLWYGLDTALSNMRESNAIVYLRTDGSAYFGGALSAGVLKNSATGTGEEPNAYVILGPFGSNGGTRTVTFSYLYDRNVVFSSGGAASGQPSATIVLSRDGVAISSFDVTGTASASPAGGPGEPGGGQEYMSGSSTYTDTSGGDSVSYKAQIVNRTNANLSGEISSSTVRQQIGIVSIEE